MGVLSRRRCVALCVALSAAISCVRAAPAGVMPPDHGFTWKTIGNAGNRATNPSEVPTYPQLQLGAVAHEFRMATTQVTVGQFFEFVRAFAPYNQWGEVTPYGVIANAYIYNTGGQWTMTPFARDLPVETSWRFAAMYCNWLCNDKGTTREAFETGAYDVSTFNFRQDGDPLFWTDQRARTPGARFFLPTLDEWVKGFHYDPDRYGQGRGGYWQYPNGTDTPMIAGFPWDGGQHALGYNGVPVGSYPDQQSPYGLLDGSNWVPQWTETAGATGKRLMRNWDLGFFDPVRLEGYGEFLSPDFTAFGFGFRVAATIPAPSIAWPICAAASMVTALRRRSR